MNPDTSSASGQIPQPPVSRLVRSAGLTGIATLTSRVLGLVRDQVLAALFGAGNEMDAFIVAFRIPNLVRDLFAEGALSAAFVPTFTRHLTQHGREDAWRLGNNVLNALLITTLTLVVVGMLFTEPLVRLYAGDFAHVPGKLELTIRLTRVVLPFLTMVTIAAAAMGMLNSLHHYFVPALAPAAFNVASIVCALTLVPIMPALGLPRIMAVAFGAIIGGVGQVVIQWPALRAEGFRYSAILDPRDPGLRQVLLLMGPGAIGLAATQVNIFVNTLLATGEGPGAVSWLTYAFRVMYLPIGLFGVSIGTAVLPAVSRHAATGDRAGVRTTVSRGIALMLMLNVPAVAGLMLLATPIVQVLFERGRFLPADTAATAGALRFYAVGLIGYSAVRIAAPTFYAIGRSRVPVIVSTCAIALNVILSATLVHFIGFVGLALGASIAATGNAILLLWLLHRELDGLDVRDIATVLVKAMLATLAMAVAVAAVEYGLANILPGSGFTARTVRLGVSIGAGIIALATTARLLRIREFTDIVTMVVGRLRSRASGVA
jgi:putative peptidoglycan lipid II flippase